MLLFCGPIRDDAGLPELGTREEVFIKMEHPDLLSALRAELRIFSFTFDVLI